jgi:hypothetical protein
VAINRNKVFLFSHSTHSPHVSVRAGHLQVNVIVSCEASYCLLTDPLFRLSLYILSLIIKHILCSVSFVSSLVMYLKMVIYKNAVISYSNILVKIINTISCKITSDMS